MHAYTIRVRYRLFVLNFYFPQIKKKNHFSLNVSKKQQPVTPYIPANVEGCYIINQHHLIRFYVF